MRIAKLAGRSAPMIRSRLTPLAHVCMLFGALMALSGCGELQPAEEPMPLIGQPLAIPTQPNPHAIGIGPMPGDPDAITAYLNRPERMVRGAVILLHGCQGLDLGTRLAL